MGGPSEAGNSDAGQTSGPQPGLGFLHIPKTGGTAVFSAVRENTKLQGAIVRWGHFDSLETVTSPRVFFFVRDPIERVVSAFYSRKRQGQPRYRSPHSRREAQTFSQFSDFEELVLGVAADDPQALAGYESIGHLRPLANWLISKEAVRNHQIAFIGETHRLSRDWPRIKERLHLPPSAVLPTDPVRSHKAPSPHPPLSKTAVSFLRKFLKSDYELYEECLRIRTERGWG